MDDHFVTFLAMRCYKSMQLFYYISLQILLQIYGGITYLGRVLGRHFSSSIPGLLFDVDQKRKVDLGSRLYISMQLITFLAFIVFLCPT